MRLPVPGGADRLTLALFRLDAGTGPPPEPPTRSRRPLTLRPIHVGLPYPASGRGSSDAAEMANGAALAVAEANARGGIHGREVQLVPKPFHNSDDNAAVAAYRALIEEEVEAVTAGYACYSPQVHDLIGDARLPYLLPPR